MELICGICGLPTLSNTICVQCYPAQPVCVCCRDDGHHHKNNCPHPYSEPIVEPLTLLATDLSVTPDTPVARKRCAVCKIEQ